jgi:hypothetical protein
LAAAVVVRRAMRLRRRPILRTRLTMFPVAGHYPAAYRHCLYLRRPLLPWTRLKLDRPFRPLSFGRSRSNPCLVR